MICLDPRTRKTVTIDAMPFVIRPLTAAERIAFHGLKGAELYRAMMVGVVSCGSDAHKDWPLDAIIDGLDSAAFVKLYSEVAALSFPSDDDEKNCESVPRSSMDVAPTQAAKQ